MRVVARRVYVCGGAAAAACVRRLSTTAMTLPPSAEAAAHERSISSAAAASRSSSIVCTSLAQAHVRLSMLLLQQQEQQQRQHSTVSSPSSSLSLSSSSRALSTAAALMRVRAWWHAAQSRVLVPRDVYAIEDMPLLLLEVVRGRQLHHVLAEQQRRSVLAAHAWAKAAATTTTAAAAAAAVTANEGGLERFVHMSEEAILREFDEWVCMHSPLYTQPSSNSSSSGNTPVTSVVPYTTMMRFVASYVRYHRGVRWGSAAAAAAATATATSSSSLHKSPSGNYVLHPFHDLYCPHSHVAQMPYVHVLQWMRDRRGSTNNNNKDNSKDSARDVDDAHTESADEQVRLWQQHRARRACALPHGFAALDVCCQSGYAVDLLLKAGAAHITAVDTTPLPLANTEATAREHVRDKRSRAAYERRVQVQQCELLPVADTTTTQTTVAMQHDNASPATRQRSSSSSDSCTSNAFADAAARRRQRARQLGRCGAVDTLPDVSDAEGTADAALSSLRQQEQEQHAPRSYDVLYVHPPPPMLLPVTTLTTAASLLQQQQQQRRRSTWWQLVHTVAAEEGEQKRTARSSSSLAQQHILLPYTVCAADAPPHPHSSMHALQQLVQSLRDDVTRRCPHDVSQHQSQSQPQQPSSLLPCALLRDDGYVVMVLPRTFDVDELMQMLSHTTTTTPLSSYALSDFVVTQLDGLYDVVLRRRHCANELAVAAVVDNNSSSDDAALWRFLLAQVQPVAQQQHMRRAASEAAWREVCTFAQTHMWTDVLVLQKRADVARAHRTRLWRSSTGGSSVDAAAQQLLQQPPLHNNNNNTTHDDDNDDDDDSNPVSREGVRWQDSFEYNEYKPRSAGAPTTHHWSDRVPSYSYLEADYWSPAEREAASRNYLAVGHTPQLQRTTTTTTQSTTTTTTTPVTKDGTVRAVAEAAARFRGIFDAELRRRRRTRIRKAALGTHAQQEWLIDAKLARSQAAKVEFMNEVSRYNLKEPTD